MPGLHIKTHRSKFIALAILLSFILIPTGAYASKHEPQFENPLGSGSAKSIIATMLQNVTSFLIVLGTALSLTAIVYGGVSLIIGGIGGERQLLAGKRILLWGIIGLIVIGLAGIIIQVIGGNILKVIPGVIL